MAMTAPATTKITMRTCIQIQKRGICTDELLDDRLAKEFGPHGIRVNAVSPGTVDNNFHATFSTPQMLDNVRAQTPQGRLSTNEDMAGVILFLCSDAAVNILGQTIEINGGAYMV